MPLLHHRRHQLKKVAFQLLYEFRCLKVYRICMFEDLEKLSFFHRIINGIWLDSNKLRESTFTSIPIMPKIFL